MDIKRIKKMSDNRYKLELEDNKSIIVYEDVILEENILYKKEISDDKLKEISQKNDYYKIYNKTIKYIMTKIRSEKEVIEYLKKQEIDNEIINKIIIKLKDIKLINDDVYFKSYIIDRINLSTDGPKKIKEHLINNNITEEKITNELDKYENEFKIKLEKLVNKKIKNPKQSEYALKQKLLSYFINLGYYKDQIESELNKVNINSYDALKVEYEKQLRKLSKKYDGDELIFNIKNNLYKKGYKLDEIKKVIE